MLIKTFSVENFRSIDIAKDLPISNLSILIGPNNEGKSNILRALVLILNYIIKQRPYLILRGHLIRYRQPRRWNRNRVDYIWERDFPVKLQQSKPNGMSKFELEFELNSKEKNHLYKSIKKKLNGNLKIKLFLGNNNRVKFEIYDSLKRNKKFPEDKIFNFFRKRLLVQYISAIRTSETTQDVVDDMISSELSVLTEKQEYNKLLEKMNKMEKPILRKLSKNLTKSVSNFLSDVTSIEISTEERIRNMRSSCKVFVDDGTKTELELKGDGIKSLLAISIIQHLARQEAVDKSIILAIEEPESHLHPSAIHRFKGVLEEISRNNQVIITTHSPLLVNRSVVKSNLLVNKSKAMVASNISEVRNLLGVHVSDNLMSANLVILVEGQSDIKILKKWLYQSSRNIRKKLEEGFIVFDHLSGSSNLSHKIALWKSFLCDVFVILDNDKAGIESFESAEKKGLITEKEVFLTNVKGFKESEIEDFIKLEVYNNVILSKFGVDLNDSSFKNNKNKWSKRIEETFRKQGKRGLANREEQIKSLVAEQVEVEEIDSLKEICKPILNKIIREIENYIGKN